MMILSIVKITPAPEQRNEVLSILRSIRGPIQAINGCLDCRICEVEGEEDEVLFLEHWQSWESFMRHIRSEIYVRLLRAMDLSRCEPDVSFFEVTELRGMEILKAVRDQNA
jgi:quinol monooxygenase YgiN